jgi:hypothetical protein
VLFLESEIHLVIGCGAPLLAEYLGSPALLRVEGLPGTALVAALVGLRVEDAPLATLYSSGCSLRSTPSYG